MTALTIGVRKNGTARSGFMTTGVPKVIGSLMLNSAGPPPRRPSVLNWVDLAHSSM